MLLTYKHIGKKRGDNKSYREKAKYILYSKLHLYDYRTVQIKKKN